MTSKIEVSRSLVLSAVKDMILELSEEEILAIEDYIVNECDKDSNLFRDFIL